MTETWLLHQIEDLVEANGNLARQLAECRAGLTGEPTLVGDLVKLYQENYVAARAIALEQYRTTGNPQLDQVAHTVASAIVQAQAIKERTIT